MKVIKVLGNNVVRADDPSHGEVILIGKGIGFKHKTGNIIDANEVEKTFVLHDQAEKIKYEQLLNHVSDQLIAAIDEVMLYLKHEFTDLPQNLVVNLTDHVAFCIKRLQTEMIMKNPFLTETKLLYPDDFRIARNVVKLLNNRLQIEMPDDEIGFIALYIHSASQKKTMKDIRNTTHIISIILELVETEMQTKLNKNELQYSRFIRHLQFAIERIKTREAFEESLPITEIVKEKYSYSYQLAIKIGKVLKEYLDSSISEAEIIYLTIHLQRFIISDKSVNIDK